MHGGFELALCKKPSNYPLFDFLTFAFVVGVSGLSAKIWVHNPDCRTAPPSCVSYYTEPNYTVSGHPWC